MGAPPPNPTTPNPSWITPLNSFFKHLGLSANLPETSKKDDAYTDMIRGVLKVEKVERGKITCVLTVKPPLLNFLGSLHGGAIAAVAELVSVACVKSVVDKELFLGELATSYFSAAFVNDELEVGGFLVRYGRNVTVTSVEFRIKETKKLVYTARATFYNLPVANL